MSALLFLGWGAVWDFCHWQQCWVCSNLSLIYMLSLKGEKKVLMLFLLPPCKLLTVRWTAFQCPGAILGNYSTSNSKQVLKPKRIIYNYRQFTYKNTTAFWSEWMPRRLTCQLYLNVARKIWKWSTFCVALFWKQIWGLMECWRAHSHAKIHWQAKQHIESHGARGREREREREFNFSTSFQTANVPCSSERKIRLSICSTHTVSKHKKSMLQSRY